jgi:hypothetical protein
MAKPNTVVVYRGPSQIDGQPIVALLSGLQQKSANRKTGNTLQTWILREDQHPQEALNSGNDKSICGGCKFRKVLNGGCYVRVSQAPAAIWRAYKRGGTPEINLTQLAQLTTGRVVRLGSYGDPTAVPIEVWEAALSTASGHLGYTHQWRVKRFQKYKTMLMASVDMPHEKVEAANLGWGTFHVRPKGDASKDPDEMVCPASAEMGHAVDCTQCLACDGKSQSHVTIQAHGAGALRLNKFVERWQAKHAA